MDVEARLKRIEATIAGRGKRLLVIRNGDKDEAIRRYEEQYRCTYVPGDRRVVLLQLDRITLTSREQLEHENARL
jgi:hypothetical protein